MKISYLAISLLALGGLGADCSTPPSPPSPNLPLIDGGHPCEASCANQRRLQCPGATGASSPAGKPCEEVCRTTKADLHPECVAVAVDCAAVKACFGH